MPFAYVKNKLGANVWNLICEKFVKKLIVTQKSTATHFLNEMFAFIKVL